VKPTVLILGVTGRFGAAVMVCFVKQGWQVVAQSRSAGTPTQGVQWLSAASKDEQTIITAAKGACLVVHASNPTYTAWASELLPLTERAMNIAQALNATLLFPGNVYNFGSAMPPRLSETTAQQADTRKGKLRVQLESAIAKRCEQGLRATVLRAGDFFGGGTGTWFDLAITKDLRKGRIVYPGPLDVPHAWAYLPDLAEAAVQLAQQALKTPSNFKAFEVFHFAGHTLTGRQLSDKITKLHGAPTKVSSMPWRVITLGGIVVPMWREVAEMRYLWTTAHALDGSKLASRIGPIQQTPIDEALQNTLSISTSRSL
jgi:nucleoside-diphosphate-sugar epimerase